MQGNKATFAELCATDYQAICGDVLKAEPDCF
jgi:hypothetical protein